MPANERVSNPLVQVRDGLSIDPGRIESVQRIISHAGCDPIELYEVVATMKSGTRHTWTWPKGDPRADEKSVIVFDMLVSLRG